MSVRATAASSSLTDVFDGVVCGLSGHDGADLARLAATLTSPDGRLILVHVDPLAAELEAVRRSSPYGPEPHVRAAASIERARDAAAAVRPVETRTVFGHAARRLLDELAATHATLAVVGAGPRSRVAGAARASVATQLVHAAPCSVLVVRDVADVSTFPRSIVVGDDRSLGAARALAAAEELHDRFGASLHVLADEARPVEALVAASEDADLVVVGSRGLRGLRALGSVSERVAHAARCSVLVVR